jgi:hypothetical protein
MTITTAQKIAAFLTSGISYRIYSAAAIPVEFGSDKDTDE